MAHIRRHGARYEIRECLHTPRGPRQHTLASFRGVLTPEVLDEAEENASRPLRRAELLARAHRMQIPVTLQRRYPFARKLLARLRHGGSLDPTLVTLLRAALEGRPAEALPEHLGDAAEWLGQSEAERGKALRGLLRTADRVLQSREPLRARPSERFPRFRSADGQ